jgi:hypothetical protein
VGKSRSPDASIAGLAQQPDQPKGAVTALDLAKTAEVAAVVSI